MLQQTPRAVTVAPPSEVTVPPLAAVVVKTAVAAVVVTVGATGGAEMIKAALLTSEIDALEASLIFTRQFVDGVFGTVQVWEPSFGVELTMVA